MRVQANLQIILIAKMDRDLMPESYLKCQTGGLIYLELSGLAADMGAEDAQVDTSSESDWKIRWGPDLGLMIIGLSDLDLRDYDDRQRCWSSQALLLEGCHPFHPKSSSHHMCSFTHVWEPLGTGVQAEHFAWTKRTWRTTWRNYSEPIPRRLHKRVNARGTQSH